MNEHELAELNGLQEVTSDYEGFVNLIVTGTGDLSDSEVGHLATIGADYYIFHNANYSGYIVALQGHAGGDIVGPQRKRPMTYWVTPGGWTQLQSWKAVIAFVTGCVEADLTAEWEH